MADYLVISLHGVVVWEYENIFNAKYFLISSRVTALCSRNRSAVLTYIYMHTHKVLSTGEWRWQTPTHTQAWSCLHKHTSLHLVTRFFFQHFQERFHCMHTQVAVYWRCGWRWQTHIHTHCTNTHYSLTPTGVFLLHVYSVTRNLRTYFTSVRQVFLVETGVLQTIL